ncbi:MOB kinase activator 2 [Neophocaena asiaeorientalis asiaeorientalis]|uniref:MOB kinase activator 2 n=1 Tax=Neophocaena asiaeorientalis asiaeorientalis TaxID=1706337 RepID=A0A341BRM6_NEOAA|nr:MOB kinase activator 2 [Neophocaena asiaeorientalis asiaeorientalis]
MLGDHSSVPTDRALLSQPPKTGLSCKMVLQAVGKVLRKSKAKPNGKKPVAEEKKVYLEPEYTKSRITDFGFKELVVLPREIDLNEWLASNTTTFFHHVNLQYSTISEFCTGEACQTMAVCNTQYYWYDERGKKVKCTAPQYVDFVMSSVQKLVTDEDVFPTKYGREFPSSFESLVKKICKYLFHVLAHIYSSHFKETLALELHGHLNTLYVHFILFAREFNLLDPKFLRGGGRTEPREGEVSPAARVRRGGARSVGAGALRRRHRGLWDSARLLSRHLGTAPVQVPFCGSVSPGLLRLPRHPARPPGRHATGRAPSPEVGTAGFASTVFRLG